MKTRSKVMLSGLLAIICLFGLFDHSLWSGNDTREGAMIAEMARERVWVAPVFNGAHYLEKPPLLHWTGAVFCRLAGSPSEGLVRLPSALFSFLTLMVMLSWARALGREQAGYAAAFMCAVSVLFFEYARIVLTDSALMFMVFFSLWLFWRAQTAETGFKKRYAAFLIVSALSFYAKGLIGPGMVWVSVAAWLIVQKRFRLALALAPLFAAIFVLVLAPWVLALWKAGGSEYLYTVFWENQFGRFLHFSDPGLPLDPYHVHKEPVYFYLLSLPLRLLPWTLLVVPALVYWFRRGGAISGPVPFFLKTCLVCMAVILHVSSAKAACYALPLFPFLFLMTGVWLEDVAADWSKRVDRNLVGFTYLAIGAAVLAAPAAYMFAWLFDVRAALTSSAAVNAVCLGMAVMALSTGLLLARNVWLAFKQGKRRAAILVTPVVVAVTGVVGASAFVPAVDFYRSYKPFAALVGKEISSGRRVVFALQAERDIGAFMFYLNSRVETVAMDERGAVQNLLHGRSGPVGIVVPSKKLRELLVQIPGDGYRVARADEGGRKSDSFRLVLIDPPGEAAVDAPRASSLSRASRRGRQ